MIFRPLIAVPLLILSVTFSGSKGISQDADPSQIPSSDAAAAAKLNGWWSDANPIWIMGEYTAGPFPVWNLGPGVGSEHPFLVPPLIFLEQLQKRAEPGGRMNAVWPAPKDWISLQDAVELFRFVDSEEPCLAPTNVLSSIAGPSRSTVGNEARRMICGCIYGGYPPVSPAGMEVEILKKQLLERVADEIDSNVKNREKR